MGQGEDRQTVVMAQVDLGGVVRWLEDKHAAGVKQVRVTSMLERLGAAARDRLMGLAEVAEMLGVEKSRIVRMRQSGDMPEPVFEFKSGPVWLESQLSAVAELVESRRRRPREAAGA